MLQFCENTRSSPLVMSVPDIMLATKKMSSSAVTILDLFKPGSRPSVFVSKSFNKWYTSLLSSRYCRVSNVLVDNARVYSSGASSGLASADQWYGRRAGGRHAYPGIEIIGHLFDPVLVVIGDECIRVV